MKLLYHIEAAFDHGVGAASEVDDSPVPFEVPSFEG